MPLGAARGRRSDRRGGGAGGRRPGSRRGRRAAPPWPHPGPWVCPASCSPQECSGVQSSGFASTGFDHVLVRVVLIAGDAGAHRAGSPHVRRGARRCGRSPDRARVNGPREHGAHRRSSRSSYRDPTAITTVTRPRDALISGGCGRRSWCDIQGYPPPMRRLLVGISTAITSGTPGRGLDRARIIQDRGGGAAGIRNGEADRVVHLYLATRGGSERSREVPAAEVALRRAAGAVLPAQPGAV